ncbi:hypothetical protein GLOIN_2v1664022, partial [Rhizophagus irregularis DAOM 181602=DAOM 197198]
MLLHRVVLQVVLQMLLHRVVVLLHLLDQVKFQVVRYLVLPLENRVVRYRLMNQQRHFHLVMVKYRVLHQVILHLVQIILIIPIIPQEKYLMKIKIQIIKMLQ